jgi:hypothetical protein
LLLAQVSGGDHVAIRLLMQLGLRSEELFALRKNDLRSGELVIDKASCHRRNEGTEGPGLRRGHVYATEPGGRADAPTPKQSTAARTRGCFLPPVNIAPCGPRISFIGF